MRAATDLVLGQIPGRMPTNVCFHGKIVALDKALSGRVRMATALGSEPASLRTRLSESLAVIGSIGTSEIITETVLGDVPDGSVLLLDRREHVQTFSCIRSTGAVGNRTTYNLTTPLADVYAPGTSVELSSFPVEIVQGTDVDAHKILVDSSEILAPGDVLATVERPNSIMYLTDTAKIVSAAVVFQFNNRLRYLLEITTPLAPLREGTAHVRAGLAYESEEIPLPALSGPYLADIIGGKIFGTGKENISLSVGFDGEKAEMKARNAVLCSVPVCAGSLGLLQHQHGSSSIRSEDELVCTPEQERWGCGVVLPLEAPVHIDLLFSVTAPATLFVDVDGAIETIQLTPGTAQLVRRTLTGTVIVLRMRTIGPFTIRTNPMRDGISSLRYSYVVPTAGDDVWAGGSLLLKPLLPQVSDQLAVNADGDTMAISCGGIIL